jgi:hypothetical protein
LVASARIIGRFHEFKVDLRYPHNAGFIVVPLDPIFECFYVVLPYSVHRVGSDISDIIIHREL